jgi:hypothetical protein
MQEHERIKLNTKDFTCEPTHLHTAKQEQNLPMMIAVQSQVSKASPHSTSAAERILEKKEEVEVTPIS